MKNLKSLCLVFILFIGNAGALLAQNYDSNKDSIFFKQLFDESLLKGHSYARLGELCKQIEKNSVQVDGCGGCQAMPAAVF